MNIILLYLLYKKTKLYDYNIGTYYITIYYRYVLPYNISNNNKLMLVINNYYIK